MVGDGGVLLQNPQAHLMFVFVKMPNFDDSTVFYRPNSMFPRNRYVASVNTLRLQPCVVIGLFILTSYTYKYMKSLKDIF